MYKREFDHNEVAGFVMKVVGEIEPVGETNVDNIRFSNLQTLMDALNILIDKVCEVIPFENRYEESMKKAGREAKRWAYGNYYEFAHILGCEEEGEEE